MSVKSLALVMSFFAIVTACGDDDSSSLGSQPTASDVGPTATATALVVDATGNGDLTIFPGIEDLLDGPFSIRPGASEMSTELAANVTFNEDAGARHVASEKAGTGYHERPATSGDHWFAPTTPAGVPAPARWGIYEFALPDEVLVHNLEHGGIGIHYDCPDECEKLVDALRKLVPQNPSQFIVSPYPGMKTQIAITAWRTHMYLEEFDESLIREFISVFKDKAPESVPGNTF